MLNFTRPQILWNTQSDTSHFQSLLVILVPFIQKILWLISYSCHFSKMEIWRYRFVLNICISMNVYPKNEILEPRINSDTEKLRLSNSFLSMSGYLSSRKECFSVSSVAAGCCRYDEGIPREKIISHILQDSHIFINSPKFPWCLRVASPIPEQYLLEWFPSLDLFVMVACVMFTGYIIFTFVHIGIHVFNNFNNHDLLVQECNQVN